MTALLLAAHGDGEDSASNSLAERLVREAAALGGFSESLVAFQKGSPRFSEALENVTGPNVTVVPLMASSGYYCKSVLPRELQKNSRYHSLKLTLTEPIGTHGGLLKLVKERVASVLRGLAWQAGDTSVMVVGHGTRRHSESRVSTELLAAGLAEGSALKRVVYAFLDEAPGPEAVLAEIGDSSCLVIPFLMGSGTHATRDLPRRLAGGKVHIDLALGTLPGIEHLIVARALAHKVLGEGQ